MCLHFHLKLLHKPESKHYHQSKISFLLHYTDMAEKIGRKCHCFVQKKRNGYCSAVAFYIDQFLFCFSSLKYPVSIHMGDEVELGVPKLTFPLVGKWLFFPSRLSGRNDWRLSHSNAPCRVLSSMPMITKIINSTTVIIIMSDFYKLICDFNKLEGITGTVMYMGGLRIKLLIIWFLFY